MVSGGADVKAGEKVRRLARGSQHSGHTTLQGSYLGRDHVVGGILQSGVEITAVLKVEKTTHLVRSLVFESCALHDGNLPGVALPGVVTSLDTQGSNTESSFS